MQFFEEISCETLAPDASAGVASPTLRLRSTQREGARNDGCCVFLDKLQFMLLFGRKIPRKVYPLKVGMSSQKLTV